MKHTSNTSPYPSPYNLVIGNQLQVPVINTVDITATSVSTNTVDAVDIESTNVSTNTVVATTSTAVTVNATTVNATTVNTTNLAVPTINTTTLNTTTNNSTTVNTNNLVIDGANLDYQFGTWTPLVQSLKPGGGDILHMENWKDQYNNLGEGYYVKIGKVVTVWFEASAQFGGFQNDFVYFPRYPVVTGLPFKCYVAGTSIDLDFVGAMSAASFPNGYVGPIPFPAAITMNGGYKPILYEEGYTFTPQIAPLFIPPSALWTADGYTIVFSCMQGQSIPLVAEWSLEGTPYNFNVVVSGSYTASFKGNITYFTDE
ncbi:MAG: hypothetical protein V4708_17505 [Bacteroidota bacterium]